MPNQFDASNKFMTWVQNVSGLLTEMKTSYGSISEMVEHPTWDEDQTQFALSIIRSLSRNLSNMEKELARHVNEKYGKEPR